MRAVEFTAYGPALQVLKVALDAPAPVPGPTEVLIEVRAASVNPVDCAIRRGYGREVFRFKGQIGPHLFPQRLGRDAAGVVRAVGAAVRTYHPGDRVYCAPTRAAQADLIAVETSEVAPMPAALSFVEAASLPFVALTAWSALVGQAQLSEASARDRRVLITRGAGGVGSFAIQLLKTWGAYVATTCSPRTADFVTRLAPDRVIDYTRESIADAVGDIDVALDSSFDTEVAVLATLKTGADATYVTIVSPKMRLIDEFGLEEGTRRADECLAERVQVQAKLGRRYYWGFMKPDGAALAAVTRLVDEGKIRPLVDKVFALDQIALAHEYCESGQARGKIVIDLT
jgi:NADPH:quinone reductase-like Zn-dependent oxidoreductase